MSLKYGKSEIAKMVEVFESEEFDSAEDAAKAALAVAEEIFEKRAKFVVVGQLKASKDRLEIPASDPEAIKLSLGWYSTEGDARSAADSLWHSTASGDTFRCWVLNVFHGSPADFHAKRKEHYVALEAKQKEAKSERMKAEIEKKRQEDAIRAAGGKGACTCGHIQAEHRFDGSSRGQCGLTECPCPKWKERTS